jgi:formamidopyrimidine-DNA glycosylase
MPELPEVETICRWLREGGGGRPSLVGMRFRSAQVLWKRTLAAPQEEEEFYARLCGQEIRSLYRRGKFLVFELTDKYLIMHLRMSGDIWLEAPDAPLAPHHRLVLELESPQAKGTGIRLGFNDARKFGRVWLVRDAQEVLGELGPEPLAESFTAEKLHERLVKTRRRLKPLLLDQHFVAGLGNIYTDEALHLAQLHPLRIASTLSESEARKLWSAIREVLQEGIRRSGASIDWVYRGGDFQNYFRVYQRAGKACPVCGTKIERMLVGQRGTHFCPQCQKLNGG